MQTSARISKQNVACIVAIALSGLVILLAFFGRYFPTGGFRSFCNFFVGAFGMSLFGTLIAVIVGCAFYLAGKRIIIPKKYVFNFILMYLVIIVLVHMYSTTFIFNAAAGNYAVYTAYCYDYYTVPTFAGVVLGSVSYALQSALTIFGASFLLFALLALTIFLAVDFIYEYASHRIVLTGAGNRDIPRETDEDDVAPSAVTLNAVTAENLKPAYTAEQILFQERFDEEEEKDDASDASADPQEYGTAARSVLNNDPDPSPFNIGTVSTEEFLFGKDDMDEEEQPSGHSFFDKPKRQIDLFSDDFALPEEEETPQEPLRETTTDAKAQDDADNPADTYPVDVFAAPPTDEPAVVEEDEEEAPEEQEIEEYEAPVETTEEEEETEEIPAEEDEPKEKYTVIDIQTPVEGGFQQGFDFVETEKLEQQKAAVHHYLEYEKPPVELLNDEVLRGDTDMYQHRKAAEAIVNKLAVFGIMTEAVEPVIGPSVTQYRVNVLSKTRMSVFPNYASDLRSCLESVEDVRVIAPIPGTNLVGVEVANKEKTPVMLRSVIESDAFKNAKGNLVFAIGREVNGTNVVADLAEMPHLLIAGTTGSGKSVCLNCMIVSMIYRYSPEYLRFLMVDPKYVELSRYNGSPHLLTSEAITEVGDALCGMDYLISEMESRFQLFRDNAVSNIAEYNKKIDTRFVQKLPYIVLVVDELADIMATSKKAFEAKLIRLAQKSRAAGIHIVLATQRPSVDIITGTIKANLPCRMALKVASFPDSKTILDSAGAEKLLGKGDMLLLYGSPTPTRIQSAYVSNDEIRTLIDYSIKQNEVYYQDDIAKSIFASKQPAAEEPHEKPKEADRDSETDPFLRKALRYWLERNKGLASIASIQRGLRIGFNRAGKIFESLVAMHYIEEIPANESNSKPRKVLVTLEDLPDLFPDMDDTI